MVKHFEIKTVRNIAITSEHFKRLDNKRENNSNQSLQHMEQNMRQLNNKIQT
jgi:hypothetical protein